MIGTRLGPYQIVEEVGRGGMAVVYRAHQASMERDVAVKVISGNISSDDQAIMRFQREARLIARLEHPHILPVYDFDGAHRPPYIVMRYLDGGTLKDIMQCGALPLEEALLLLQQVASALDYAHRLGIIHRDIKPSNIMIDREGNAFVTDFGIARLADAGEHQITSAGAILGTPDYMSPEQILGDSNLDAHADQYSLAVMTFQMLAGRLPFQAEAPMGLVVMHLHTPPPNITSFNPALPPTANEVFEIALSKEPQGRYPNVMDFYQTLTQAIGSRAALRPKYLRIAAQTSLEMRQANTQITTEQSATGSSITPGEQNKAVAILCASAAEYAGLVAELKGPEAARRAMKALWDSSALRIAERGGQVLERSEHDLLAAWGVDASGEDDAQQAVFAALDLQNTLRDQGWAVLAEDEDANEPLPIKIGVHSGLALLVRNTESSTWSASGSPVSLARRLSEQANGKILISRDTFRSVQGLFDILPDNPLLLRGRKDPIQVYNVICAKARSLRQHLRSIEGIETRLVGRDAELKRLQNAYLDAYEEQETQLVTILANAGLGKSRLMYEFSQWAELRAEKFWVLRGRASAAMTNRPYALLRDIISYRFEILDNDTPVVVRQKLETGIARLMGSDPKMAHLIGYLCGFDLSESPYISRQKDDPAQLSSQARQATIEFFRWLGQNGPAILELDDLHYADTASLELLNELLRCQPNLSLLAIALARPGLLERCSSWGEEVRYHTRLSLPPLERRESRDLVAEILQKVPDVPRNLRDLLVERGEGNPLYIEELVRMLIEDHVIIKKTDDVWQIETSRIENLRVPPTLVGVLQTRFDSLLYPEKVVLQRASAVGRIFFDSLLRAMNGADDLQLDNLDTLLDDLEKRDFIHRREFSSFAGCREYAFNQNMLRDQIYETLLERQRSAYHTRIAEWVKVTAGDRVAEYAPLIADNYERGGQLDKASQFLHSAGQQAIERGAFAEAARLLERGIALCSDITCIEALEMSLLLADALVRDTNFQKASVLLDQLLISAQQSNAVGAQARAHYLLSQIETFRGNWDAALAHLSCALPLARDSGDANALAWVLYGLADTNLRIGHADQSLQYAEESMIIARQSGYPIIERQCLNRMGTAYATLQRTEEAIVTYQELLAQAHRTSDQHMTLAALVNLGQVHWQQGNYQASTQYTEQALALAGDRDFPYLVAAVNLSRCYAFSNQIPRARRMVAEALQRSRKIDTFAWTLGCLAWAGVVEIAAGNPEHGLALVGLAYASPHFASDFRDEVNGDLNRLPLNQYTQAQIQAIMKSGEALNLDTEIQNILEAGLRTPSDQID